jgi:hypothetical protein
MKMTRRPSIVLTGVLLLSAGGAEAQKEESVMFGDEMPSLKPDGSMSTEAGNRCEELLSKVDALEGRPQQRATAMAVYEAECHGAAATNPSQPAKP